MTSPPTLTPGKLESWGPKTVIHQVRVAGVTDLILKHLAISRDEAEVLLHASPGQHRYLLLEQLHQTGHAAVYLGIDQMLVRMVAVKMDLRELDDIAKWNAFRESRTQALFEHDNILRVLDVGEVEGIHYAVTELCDGDMLGWSRGKPWQVVLRRIIEAGHGLEALHAAGFVHCDVKPANILIKDGVAKIGDFGHATQPTRATQIGGTPGYIAPEAGAGIVQPLGDVFGLASTAWTCLFGELPFTELEGVDDPELNIKFLIEEALDEIYREPPAGSDVPGAVIDVIRRGLAPHPRVRPTMSEWLRELERCADVTVSRRWRVHPQALGGAAFGLLAALAILPWIAGPRVQSQSQPESTVLEQQQAPQPQIQLEVQGEVEAAELPTCELHDPNRDYEDYAERLDQGTATPEEGLELATSMIESAESEDATTPKATAKLARDLANQLRPTRRDKAFDDALVAVIQRADAINQSTRSSHPG